MRGYKRILFLIILPTKHDSNSVFLSSSSASHFPATPRIGSPPLGLENKTLNSTGFHFHEAFLFLFILECKDLPTLSQDEREPNIRSNALKRQQLTNALCLYENLKQFRDRVETKASFSNWVPVVLCQGRNAIIKQFAFNSL